MNLLEKALTGKTPRILALDPGQTTGACVFRGSKLEDACQLQTGLMPLAAVTVRNYLQNMNHRDIGPEIEVVVIEDYRIYSWKTDEHAWQSVHTLRLIGAIELICHDLKIPLVKQTAQQAKGFCDDLKLEQWGLYQVGLRHARDAIRHACYYLLFRIAQVQGVGKKAPNES